MKGSEPVRYRAGSMKVRGWEMKAKTRKSKLKAVLRSCKKNSFKGCLKFIFFLKWNREKMRQKIKTRKDGDHKE